MLANRKANVNAARRHQAADPAYDASLTYNRKKLRLRGKRSRRSDLYRQVKKGVRPAFRRTCTTRWALLSRTSGQGQQYDIDVLNQGICLAFCQPCLYPVRDPFADERMGQQRALDIVAVATRQAAGHGG